MFNRRRQILKNKEIGGLWKNWSENVWHVGPFRQKYMKFPQTEDDLRAVLLKAKEEGVKVRASGQRHSQAPQILEENRYIPQLKKSDTYVIDMSIYEDIRNDMPHEDERNHELAESPFVRMKVVSRDNRAREAIVVVNSGTREDEFEYFLGTNNLALKTVTAGGIFSIGGMTSNDVHGGAIKNGIFADTCAGFNIMLWDGSVIQIREDDPIRDDGFHPIQFARVNLGLLGIVTQVFVKCDFRLKQESLQGRMAFVNISIVQEFVLAFKDFVEHDRLECFYDPYTGGFMPLMWDLESNFDKTGNPNKPPELSMDTIEHAVDNFYGSSLQGLFFKKGGKLAIIENLAETTATGAQYLGKHSIVGKKGAEFFVKTAMQNIATSQVTSAFMSYSEAWLQDSARCIFMSYFIELPNLGAEGLAKTYHLLTDVADIVTKKDNFHISAPMEFRFVKAGNSAMAGTYNTNPRKVYVNLDLIAFIDPGKSAKDPKNYPEKLLKFFATVERKWFEEEGGLPHQGKMYGFYDPDGEEENYRTPFNDNFIKTLNQKRDEHAPGARQAFNKYRKELDPTDMFLNSYMKKLIS